MTCTNADIRIARTARLYRVPDGLGLPVGVAERLALYACTPARRPALPHPHGQLRAPRG